VLFSNKWYQSRRFKIDPLPRRLSAVLLAAPRSINWINICSPAALAWLRSKPQLWFGRSDLQDRYSFRRSSVRRYLRRLLRSKSSLSISTEAVAVSVIRLSRRDRVLFRSFDRVQVVETIYTNRRLCIKRKASKPDRSTHGSSPEENHAFAPLREAYR
jgi:hypothetical protein